MTTAPIEPAGALLATLLFLGVLFGENSNSAQISACERASQERDVCAMQDRGHRFHQAVVGAQRLQFAIAHALFAAGPHRLRDRHPAQQLMESREEREVRWG